MYIISYFSCNGSPKSGLVPTIKIREVESGILAIPSLDNMAELGDGFYKYNFIGRDITKQYTVVCYGNSIELQGAERYSIGIIEKGDIAENTLINTETLRDMFDVNGRLDTVLSDIKFKTDNLSDEPLSQSTIINSINSNITTLRGSDNDTLKTLSDQIDITINKLNTPDLYKANITTLALESNIENHVINALMNYNTANKTDISNSNTSIISEVNNNELLLIAIKSKTDNLSNNPISEENIINAITISENNIRGGILTIQDLSIQLNNIQSDLDNPDQYKSDISTLALESNIETHVSNALSTFSAISLTDLNTLETNILLEVNNIDPIINAIKLKTDLLPNDPASQSIVKTDIELSESDIIFVLESMTTQLTDLQTILSNPDQFKADVSLLALEDNIEPHVLNVLSSYIVPTLDDITLISSDIINEIDQNELKIDAVKLKTDLLPNDPASQSLVDNSILDSETSIKGINNIDNTNIDDKLTIINTTQLKILGLVHHNIYIDTTEFDSYNNLTSARLRIYSDSNSVGTDNNVISTYNITSMGNGPGKYYNWKQIEV